MRILIADDEPIVRRDIIDLIRHHEGVDICGEADNGKEAVEKTLKLRPDIVLMDITMPLMSGLDAAQKILSAAPSTSIIFSFESRPGSDCRRSEEAWRAGLCHKNCPA
jgi:YesN/AraC family two-component response regulator